MHDDDRELEDETLLEGEPTETEDDDGDPEASDAETAAEDDGGELVVTIGDEQPEPDERIEAPQWVKDLRKENRELKRQLKSQGGSGGAQKREVGPKPKLADFEYDEAKHEAALDAWYEAKREAETAERSAADAQAAQQREWDSRMQSHVKAKGALAVKDYDEAEETVFEALDATQQGIIISGAKDSAKLVYALAKSPKHLKELAAIKDPVQYTFAVARLETKLKTTKRRPATAPEGKPTPSNAGAARASSAALEKARARAEKTGDYTEVNRIRRAMRGGK